MKVMIKDSVSWYNNRVAEVKSIREIGGVKVYWVAMPSGLTSVEFAIRASNTMEVIDETA